MTILLCIITSKLKVLMNCVYCFSHSCGYQKAFDHYSGILSEKYPELHIVGANYDPSIMHLIGAKILVCATFT